MIEIEVKAHVDAPPERVWDLVADPTRMGEWSPETHRVTWARGSSGPALGAKFKGHNRNGWRRWTTTGKLVAYRPGRELAWDVTVGVIPVARWAYRVEPDPDGGCTVVETFVDQRGRLATGLGPFVRGVTDVEGHNRAGMQETVARIKAAAEKSI